MTALALVIGDLTFDVTWTSDEGWPDAKPVGADVTFSAQPAYHIGGTAFLFAKSLVDLTEIRPVIFSAVGSDALGGSVLTELAATGLDADTVQRTDDAGTCLVSTTYLEDGTRLMVRPTSHAGKFIDSKKVADYIADLDPSGCRFVFVSGYMLTDEHSESLRAVRILAEWAHGRQLPLVVDLVPHEFRESVGPLAEVERRLRCTPSAYIAELRTIVRLGLIQGSGKSTVQERLELAATALSNYAPIAIAQCQVDDGRYGQHCIGLAHYSSYDEWSFGESDRVGLGDRLAIARLVDPDLGLGNYSNRDDANDRKRSISARYDNSASSISNDAATNPAQ